MTADEPDWVDDLFTDATNDAALAELADVRRDLHASVDPSAVLLAHVTELWADLLRRYLPSMDVADIARVLLAVSAVVQCGTDRVADEVGITDVPLDGKRLALTLALAAAELTEGASTDDQ